MLSFRHRKAMLRDLKRKKKTKMESLVVFAFLSFSEIFFSSGLAGKSLVVWLLNG